MPGDVQKLDWLPPWPYPEAHLDGLRTAVLWAGHPENCQISQTNQTGTTENKHPQISHSQPRCHPGDRVLAAEATKAGSASEETRLIPRPPSLTGRLARIHWLLLLFFHLLLFFCYLLITFIHHNQVARKLKGKCRGQRYLNKQLENKTIKPS